MNLGKSIQLTYLSGYLLLLYEHFYANTIGFEVNFILGYFFFFVSASFHVQKIALLLPY